MCPRMAHTAKPRSLHVRLSARDAVSIRKLARNAQVSVSDMVRTLIRRARVANVSGAS